MDLATHSLRLMGVDAGERSNFVAMVADLMQRPLSVRCNQMKVNAMLDAI
ncbi:hypothetical protein [Streptomyces sp. NPDC056948]